MSRRAFCHNSLAFAMWPSFASWMSSDRMIESNRSSKVVVVRDRKALDSSHEPSFDSVLRMLHAGLCELCGTGSVRQAWERLFPSIERAAVKSNVSVRPVHAAFHQAIMESLSLYGIRQDQMCVWDRNRGGIGIAQADSKDWDWAPGYGDDHLSRAVHWADGLINAPMLKTHPVTGISGAVKNWAGAVTGINRRDDQATFAIHANRCADIGRIHALPAIRSKSRLIVMDALTPLFQTSEPNRSYESWPYGGLILGLDPVAVDRAGWEILNEYQSAIENRTWRKPPLPLHLIESSRRYGLGNWEAGCIETRFVDSNKAVFGK
ncbi:MAG: DUF362 domain-containing protein [Candidatus Omnitrophica bacterium]|nr:DUF362 domain-containing protein [Candidatus Omnitrophota bacterium]